MPAPLGGHSLLLAACLRLVVLTGAGKVAGDVMLRHSAVGDVVKALARVGALCSGGGGGQCVCACRHQNSSRSGVCNAHQERGRVPAGWAALPLILPPVLSTHAPPPGSATQATSDGRPLPPASYAFVFPVLAAVLGSPRHSDLHDPALAVVALHCGPALDVPRADSLHLLYHLLGVIPAYRDRVAPLLGQLASGGWARGRGGGSLPAGIG